MIKKLLAFAISLGLFSIFLSGCSSTEKSSIKPQPVETASTQPALDIDYSEEAYRVVADKDLVCTVLKNGLTIIAKRIPSPVFSVQALCHTGSVYEGKWLGGGLSHLLEHLLAGGSNGRRTEQQNRDLLQNIGDNSNAYTSYDTTVFFANTLPDHMAEAVDLVTGWMFTAKITEAEYKREYEVVQRELEKDLGEADWAFYQLAVSNRYLLNPIRMPVVGYQDVIRGLSRDDVYSYYRQAYVPQNIIIGVAGNVDPEEMVRVVRKYAGNVPPARVPQKAIVEEPPVSAPRISVATFPKLGQAKLELAFPSVRQYTPDMYAMDVLAAVLGSGESSILVEEVRDKLHLASAISAGDNTPAFVDGTFQIDMEVAPDKIKSATEAVLGILDRVKKEGVSDERLARAKTQLRAADAFNRQSAETVSTTLVFSYMSTGYPEDTTLTNYEKVTAEQIKVVANKYFNRGKLLTTALLPADEGKTKNGEELTPAGQLTRATDLLRDAVPTTQNATAKAETFLPTRFELQDGTVVLFKRVATAPVVSMQLYSLGGLTTEDAKTNGIGNLAMQLAPRGTTTRTAQEIATFFDSIGGQLTTSSGNNSWSWQSQFLRADLSKAMEVFADVVKNPSFPEDEVKAMQERVMAGIDSQDHDWFAGGRRYFHSQFFGASGSPYQFTTFGTKENVGKFTPEQLKKWYAEKVLKGNRVLAIYGDIDIDAAKLLVQSRIGSLKVPHEAPTAKLNSFEDWGVVPNIVVPKVPYVNVNKVQIQKWDNPEAAVFIGYRSNSLVQDRQRDALIMADTLTSGFTYPTGYIFETLRGMGLVYDANAQNFWGMNDKFPGTFWAYAACDPKNIDACVDQILLNIARLQGTDRDIDLEWFNRSKNLITSVDAMEHETAAAQATEAATDELLGLGYDNHADFTKRIQAVTVAQVRSVATTRLRNCVIAISTSKPELVKTKAGERKYETFPPVDLAPQGVQHDTAAK